MIERRTWEGLDHSMYRCMAGPRTGVPAHRNLNTKTQRDGGAEGLGVKLFDGVAPCDRRRYQVMGRLVVWGAQLCCLSLSKAAGDVGRSGVCNRCAVVVGEKGSLASRERRADH